MPENTSCNQVQPLVDAGANLTHESFAGDLDQVLEAAAAVGVRELIVTGASVADSRQAAQLASRHPGLRATAGIHPHYAGEVTEDHYEALRELLALTEVCAVGETGLDFYRDLSPRRVQEKVFERHLQLAAETGLPLFLHERDAHPRFYALLRQYRDSLSNLVVHCFTGDRDALFRYLDMDCHLGITGWICDERRGKHLIPLIGSIPANRLLLETDAPYLLPRDLPRREKLKNRRNEPRLLRHITQVVARHRGETFDQLAARTTANARRFFRLGEHETD